MSSRVAQRFFALALGAVVSVSLLACPSGPESARLLEARAVPVTLPRAAEARAGHSVTVMIALRADGQMLLNGVPVTEAQLTERLRPIPRDTAVVLSADRSVPYGRVAALLDRVKLAGFHRFALAVAVP